MKGAQHNLEFWLERLSERLRADGFEVALEAGDRLLGRLLHVLVTVDGAFCEIDVVRAERGVHVALFAETEAAAQRLAARLDAAYRAISRFANAERKLVHRIARVAQHLARGWAAQQASYPSAALERAQARLGPAARPMLGRGYHVELAGEGEDDGDPHRYDPFFALSLPAEGRRRALVWQPQRGAFMVPEALGGGIGAEAAGAAGLLLLGAAAHSPDEASRQRAFDGVEPVVETADTCCAVPDALSSLHACVPDLGACVPDCSVIDIPDCSCGA
jgi:hypothetical protein